MYLMHLFVSILSEYQFEHHYMYYGIMKTHNSPRVLLEFVIEVVYLQAGLEYPAYKYIYVRHRSGISQCRPESPALDT